jgi:hypothetical protein
VIDLISKGGNYGWVGVYEDQHVGYPPWAAQVTKPTQGIIFPIMGYKVSSSNPENSMESASIVGGYVYRGSADPCLYGRYCLRHSAVLHRLNELLYLGLGQCTARMYANG